MNHPIRSTRGLPAPRLELRWRALTSAEAKLHGDGGSICDYDLVLPLSDIDLRVPTKGPKVLRVNIGQTISSGSVADRLGKDRISVPFRDGAHAMWDRVHVGNPPVYAVVGNKAQLQEENRS